MWCGAREDWKEDKGKLDRKKTTIEYVYPTVTRENESCSAQTRGVYSNEPRRTATACRVGVWNVPVCGGSRVMVVRGGRALEMKAQF